MRVLHVVAGGGWGGAERLACAIAQGFVRAGDDVAMVPTPECASGVRREGLHVLGGSSELDGHRESRAAPSQSRAVRSHDARTLFGWARAAQPLARAFAPNVVHVHLSSPAFAASAAMLVGNTPSVWTFHLLPEKDWPLDFMMRLPSTWALRAARRIGSVLFVGVSQEDATRLSERFADVPVCCIRNVPPPSGSETAPFDRAMWGPAEHTLLFVGRLEAQKGIDRLLRSLASPLLAPISFHLVIVGDGPERSALESCAGSLGLARRVTFVGHRPAFSAMKSADLVICPSRYEGMPLVPMEAMLVGTAVVASPIACHRELFGEIRESLLPDDERAWAQSLSGLLSEPARRQELARRQAALGPRFSFPRLLEEYRSGYERALGAGSSAMRPRRGRLHRLVSLD